MENALDPLPLVHVPAKDSILPRTSLRSSSTLLHFFFRSFNTGLNSASPVDPQTLTLGESFCRSRPKLFLDTEYREGRAISPSSCVSSLWTTGGGRPSENLGTKTCSNFSTLGSIQPQRPQGLRLINPFLRKDSSRRRGRSKKICSQFSLAVSLPLPK